MPAYSRAPLPLADLKAFSNRGMSYLEMVIVITMIGVLLGVAISRLLPYLDEAERVGVLTFESQIRSMLMMVAAKRIASGQSASISELDGSNPVALMLEAPGNYVGELERSPLSSVPRRTWYFDLQTRRLVYLPGRPFGWLNGGEAPENPEFEVRVAFEDRDGNGIFDPGSDSLFGLRLQRNAGAKWLAGRGPAL